MPVLLDDVMLGPCVDCGELTAADNSFETDWNKRCHDKRYRAAGRHTPCSDARHVELCARQDESGTHSENPRPPHLYRTT